MVTWIRIAIFLEFVMARSLRQKITSRSSSHCPARVQIAVQHKLSETLDFGLETKHSWRLHHQNCNMYVKASHFQRTSQLAKWERSLNSVLSGEAGSMIAYYFNLKRIRHNNSSCREATGRVHKASKSGFNQFIRRCCGFYVTGNQTTYID